MVEQGRAQAEAGRLIPPEVVAEEMRLKWQVGREPQSDPSRAEGSGRGAGVRSRRLA